MQIYSVVYVSYIIIYQHMIRLPLFKFELLANKPMLETTLENVNILKLSKLHFVSLHTFLNVNILVGNYDVRKKIHFAYIAKS